MSILSKIGSQFQGFLADSNSGIYLYLKDHKLITAGALLGTYCFYKFITWPRNLPPGPTGWPIVGAISQLKNDFHQDLLRFSEEYKSDVVSIYIGGTLTVSLNSADAIREAFLKSEDFSDRGEFGSIFDLHDQMLTHSKYDERWRKLKSSIMSSFRQHGFGTQKSEDNINSQLDRIASTLEGKTGLPLSSTEIHEVIMKAATCVLMKMIANQSYDFDDPELLDLIERISGYQRIFFEEAEVFLHMEMFPMWLVKLMHRGVFKRCVESASGIRTILQQHIEEHRANLDKYNSRDYLEDCLIEFGNDPGFTERMITDTTIVFMPDATETFASQALWCIFFLCLHPEYQEKMVEELSRVCGANRPGLKDRGQLVLCEAVMLEGMRASSAASLSGAHTCSKDAKLRGYTIPKGSSIQANLYSVHYDPKLFPEPEKFKPERFIGKGKLVNTENLMPFGLGRRKCVGEPLTKSQVFIYMVGLVQRFKINFAEGHRPKTIQGEGDFKKVPDCKMIFTSR